MKNRLNVDYHALYLSVYSGLGSILVLQILNWVDMHFPEYYKSEYTPFFFIPFKFISFLPGILIFFSTYYFCTNKKTNNINSSIIISILIIFFSFISFVSFTFNNIGPVYISTLSHIILVLIVSPSVSIYKNFSNIELLENKEKIDDEYDENKQLFMNLLRSVFTLLSVTFSAIILINYRGIDFPWADQTRVAWMNVVPVYALYFIYGGLFVFLFTQYIYMQKIKQQKWKLIKEKCACSR